MRIFVFLLLLLSPVFSAAQTDSLRKDPQQLTTWLQLSWDLRFQHPDSAKYYGREALRLARELQHSINEAEALHNIGVIYEAQGDYANALDYANQALALYKSLEEKAGIANSSNNIGIIYDQLGNFTRALEFYKEAHNGYKALNDPEKQALVSVNLGILFKSQGEYRKVVDYYHDAYAVYRQLKRPLEIAFCEANLGSVYYYTKQYDSCLYYSLKAEKAFTEQHNWQFLPVAQLNAGMAHFKNGNTASARKYYELALEGQRRYDNPKEVAFVLNQLAILYASEKKYHKSIELLEESKSIAAPIGASPQVMEASKLLSENYAAIHSFHKAWLESSQYSILRDSLFEKEKMKALAEYQTRYETEKKEQQITLLQQESDIQKLKLRQRNYLLMSLFLLIVLGVLLVYFLLAKRKMKVRAQLKEERHRQQEAATRAVMMAEERERRRIAADLHDGIGQTLSAALIHLDRLQDQHNVYAENGNAAHKASSLIKNGYDEIRSLSHRMMPPALFKRGLSVAIKELLDKIPNDKLDISLTIDGLEERLTEEVETILYRIIQEAVQNTIKHADATTLSIQLYRDQDGIYLNIEDNGKGFDIVSLKNAEGIGMKNIHSRAALLNGSVEIYSDSSKGTLIAVVVPCNY